MGPNLMVLDKEETAAVRGWGWGESLSPSYLLLFPLDKSVVWGESLNFPPQGLSFLPVSLNNLLRIIKHQILRDNDFSI